MEYVMVIIRTAALLCKHCQLTCLLVCGVSCLNTGTGELESCGTLENFG